MILVGAKQDLASEKREVTEEQARNFAENYSEIVDVIETSAKVIIGNILKFKIFLGTT